MSENNQKKTSPSPRRKSATKRAATKKTTPTKKTAASKKAAPAETPPQPSADRTPRRAPSAPRKISAVKTFEDKGSASPKEEGIDLAAAAEKQDQPGSAPQTADPAKGAAKGASSERAATSSAPSSSEKTPAPENAAPENAAPEKAAPEKAAPEKATTKTAPKAAAMTGLKADPAAPVYTDMKKFAEYMAEINVRTREILEDVVDRRADLGRKNTETNPDPLNVSEAGTEVAAALTSNPLRLMQLQLGLWENYTKLFSTTLERMSGVEASPIAQPKPGDKRFRHKAWEENPMLDFIKQSYLLFGEWVDNAIANAEGVDAATKRRAYFHADQFLAAMSPTNVPALNPEVIDETLNSQGANWVAGFRNFMDDLERGRGELAIKQADLDYFKVGENLATTPGKVVYQNDLMQLIQYTPVTENVAERPIVIYPPWINKFYILDLQPENSFIKWLVAQGRTVFLVSWVNPEPSLKDKSFPDYMREGIFESLEAIERATGCNEVDTIGYCIGGTLLAVTLAYMAQVDDNRIKTATFFTAQTDFEEAGDLLLFVDDKQLDNLEKQIDAAGGVLEGSAMARTFNMLRPNDLIWSAFVDNYYKGKEAKKFDLLYWNADATRMTKACHLFYLKNFYRDNLLAKGELEIEGVKIDLSKVNIPIFMQAGENDHIAPYQSVYRSAKLFGGDVRYMLAGSGHIAGVINPPEKKKYHYSTNDQLPDTVEDWKEDAERHDYSWWPYWIKWLADRSEGTVPARQPGDGDLPVLEDAPGHYVLTQSE
ncbi:poly-beta-hydroxybutyrate polymerase [Parvularcula bermudensis HTCC2503]|uniref:Poly-beta-hydroxybutyrate polymerase n=1 Tax=Parvularcula bermudensis (strain ATCC BAA-594 / HTCC2503 / KCTC 12087) TaxID=314260 RepID=E0TFG7_PARBH|nr:class I poly(R)-hydroxyalkanoic acid synthase [Parvularcula bermudensis]ADM10091.1 poly-beta-hydroxybutyrate polymerase [Parvularcula bermudensis HTCC2503]